VKKVLAVLLTFLFLLAYTPGPAAAVVSTEDGDEPSQGTVLTAGVAHQADISAANDLDWFQITTGSDGWLNVQLSQSKAGEMFGLLLTSKDSAGHFNVESFSVASGVSDDLLPATDSLIYQGQPNTKYYLCVASLLYSSAADYTLTVKTTHPTPDRYEPNNTSATAYGPLVSGQAYSGAISANNDIDIYKFTTVQAGTIKASLSNLQYPYTFLLADKSTLDSVLSLTSGNLNSLSSLAGLGGLSGLEDLDSLDSDSSPDSLDDLDLGLAIADYDENNNAFLSYTGKAKTTYYLVVMSPLGCLPNVPYSLKATYPEGTPRPSVSCKSLTNSSSVTVTGTLDMDNCTVTVNGHNATVKSRKFSYVYKLANGSNSLTIVVKSKTTGKQVTVKKTVVRDSKKPTAYVSSVRRTKSTKFKVSWSGKDPSPSSGIASYDVQYRLAGTSTWHTWKSKTTAKSATFHGRKGISTYFRSLARDKAGNVSSYSSIKKTYIYR
jgi:hypothetical protein